MVIGIIAAAVIIVGAIIAVTVVPGIMRENDYNSAVALFDEGKYSEAQSAFSGMSDYKDSNYYSDESQKHLEYLEAMSLLEAGEYGDARAIFVSLADLAFLDSDVQVKECEYRAAMKNFEEGQYELSANAFERLGDYLDSSTRLKESLYRLAEETLAEDDREGAYRLFTNAGDYEDSAARAEECLVPHPETGVLYQAEGWYSSSVSLKTDAASTPWPVYLKIYSGETHVASVFIAKGANATINLPAGTYTIKEAWGDRWFGEGQMFGEDGSYTVMLFDGGNNYVELQNNYSYTITLYLSEGGNVNSESVGRDSF